MSLNIISKDATLLVVDKPAGLTVLELAKFLEQEFPELKKVERSGIVHRLDKDTSGVLLVAKTQEAFESLQKEFQEKRVEKTYLCLITGTFKKDTEILHTLLGRSPADRRKQKAYPLETPGQGAMREAITIFTVLKRYRDYTLLEIRPKTGRKHQIRAHTAFLGTPITGDKLYGFKNQKNPKGLQRQFLHATSLKIAGKEFSSPLPKELEIVLETLQPL